MKHSNKVNYIMNLFKKKEEVIEEIKEEVTLEEEVIENNDLVSEEIEEETKLESALLADGETLIYWEGDISEGTVLFSDVELSVVTPDGEYVFENGMSITVEEGVVSIVTLPESVEEQIAEIAEVVETPLEMDNELKEEIEFLKSENVDLKSQIAEIVKNNKTLLEKVDKLNSAPAVEPLHESVQEIRELSLTEKRLNTLDALRNLKK